MATKATNEVMLEGPETYHKWYALMISSFPRDLWRFVDPESEAEFPTPEAPTFDQVKENAMSFKDLNAAERAQWANMKSEFKQDETNFQRFLQEESKLRTKIFGSVGEERRSLLRAGEPLREWIRSLQTTSIPTDAQMIDLVKTRHRNLMGSKYVDWPTAGPEKWVTEWKTLMEDCQLWNPVLYQDWAGDFNLVWGEVPATQFLCKQLAAERSANNLQGWDIH